MNKVIITGVGGFLGSHLCEELLKQNITVYGIDINSDISKKFPYPNYHHIVASFEDYHNLYKKIHDDIDVFFHFAWAGGLLQESFWDYNLQLNNTKSACDAYIASVKIGCKRFINSGTNNQIEIIQFLRSVDFNPRGTDIYAAAKTSIDLICKTLSSRYDTEYIGTMIPMPYGIGNKSMQLANIVMINLLNGQSPKLIEGNNLYDMIYIDDIINAFINIALKGKSGRTYYIGHQKLKTFRQWMESIRDVIAPNVILKFGEYKDPLNLDYSNIDLNLLHNDTGFVCSADFKNSITEVAKWIKNNLM